MRFKTPLLIAITACFWLSPLPGHGMDFVRPLALLESGADALDEPQQAGFAAAPDGNSTGALKQQVAQLLAETQRQQAQLILVGDRLASAESSKAWLPLLGLGLGGVGLLAIVLAWRVSRLRRQLARQAQVAAAEQVDWQSGPRPEMASSPSIPFFAPAASPVGLQTTAASVVEVDPPPVLNFTQSMAMAAALGSGQQEAGFAPMAPAFSFGTGVPPRPVSVEELLDLDQQVEFFMVLGQEQSAIDLLLGHVRATGGTSALPYFRLLQIYRQQGDEEAYERTRDRFNQRFNAQAPDWHGDLAAGRVLMQYPEVVAKLQRAWPQPLRAVAELESLLLRRSDLEPFDMPAFHDILTLHALVRDLPSLPVLSGQERAAHGAADHAAVRSAVPPGRVKAAVAETALAAGADRAEVDFLLPLGEDAPDGDWPPQHAPEADLAARAMLANWVFSRAASPLPGGPGAAALAPASIKLDLDLSEFAPAPREFTRPAAFTDVDLRRDSRLSDMAAFDDSDLLPPITSHR
jgi:hypothetical protein